MQAVRRSLCVCISLCGFLLASAALADPQYITKAGFAERDITPDIGMEQPGGYGKSFHTKLHDPCKVRASVFDDGKQRVALVAIDALVIRQQTVAAAREAIKTRCGIEPKAVMIAASHSHSAGPTGMIVPGEFDHASDLVKKLAYEKSSTADLKYLARVEAAIADAVCDADAKRSTTRIGASTGAEAQACFNRRFRMQNGSTWTHPGVGNPAILEPAGPIDPQIGVIGAFDEQGKLTGCLVNFACHATCGGGAISADWIYYLERTVRGTFGDDAVVVFLTGCGGDITQVDNQRKFDVPQFGERSAQFVGGRIGAETVKVLLSMQGGGQTGPLAAESKTLTFNRRLPKPERLKRAQDLIEAHPDGGSDPTEWTFAKEIVLLDAIAKKRPNVDVEVQAIQVGPVAILACPAEYFVEYGLFIKGHSGFPITFPVAYANGMVGYIPTEEALGPRGGGYETRLTSYSNLEPTAGTKIAETLVEMARSLTPGPVPTPPPAPAYNGQPWNYGNVPPELD